MSYILDALKKSEVERHAGRVPTVAVPHGVLVESARPSSVRMVFWACVAIVVVLGAGWSIDRYLYPPAPAATAVPQAAPAAPLSAPPRATETRVPAPPVASGKSGEAIPRLKLAISLPTREQPSVAPPAEIASKAVVSSPPAVVPAPANESPATAPAKSGVVSYADLPSVIRQTLPPLVVGGFAAGDSGGAMVMVDDKLVREGDEVAPGVRVEKILADSAEFSFKGYRFRR